MFTGTVRHKSFRRISHLALSSKSYLWYVFIYFQDLIQWLLNNLDLSDQNEALQLANRMAECGYFFPIDDGHVLQVKNDGTYYRFQVSALLSKYSMFEIQVQKENDLISIFRRLTTGRRRVGLQRTRIMQCTFASARCRISRGSN